MLIYSAEMQRNLRLGMSDDRFRRYLDACSQNEIAACRLYAWNTAVSGAFYGPLQALEVTLRNAIHEKLRHHHGRQWLSSTSLLRSDELRMTREAGERLTDRGKTITDGRLVAELGMGFWVGLFTKAYDQSLWRPLLYRCFSPRPDRRDLYDDLDRLRTLRNRIAHHEAIYHRSLRDDFTRLESVLEALNPSTWEWVEHHSRVLEVLGTKPESLASF